MFLKLALPPFTYQLTNMYVPVYIYMQDIIDHRMVITLEIMQSDLNKADPTWVLKKK
jgi:hypothetical protein